MDRWRRLIGMVSTVALVAPPVLKAVLDRIEAEGRGKPIGEQMLTSALVSGVNGEHLGHFGARLVPMLEPPPAGPAWSGRSSRCRWSANSRISSENTSGTSEGTVFGRSDGNNITRFD
jgi:hypothetical protein